jgi:dihydroorotate dehydrogenase (NAD+) catalytic subunit
MAAVGTVELDHPVLNASGTLDPLAAQAAGVPVHEHLAAIVTKTVTPLPRQGNAAPRICETPGGMLNSIGLANPGIDAFCAESLPALRALGRPLVVSVGGFSGADYERLVSQLEGERDVVAVELNISCPNVETGCLSIGSDPDETRAVVERCRDVSSVPLWVKLSPNVSDIGAIATAAEEGGADALVLINTLRGLAIDRSSGRPLLGGPGGGLSGPAIKPVALSCIHACRGVSDLPIVGMGGIAGGEDAWQFLAAGANAVAVGTALFREPGLARRTRDELRSIVSRREVPQRAFRDGGARSGVSARLST